MYKNQLINTVDFGDEVLGGGKVKQFEQLTGVDLNSPLLSEPVVCECKPWEMECPCFEEGTLDYPFLKDAAKLKALMRIVELQVDRHVLMAHKEMFKMF